MPYRIAINGYGRIGRCILRALYESNNYAGLSIVAINDLADISTLAHLTKYDSTHGRFLGDVAVDGTRLSIEGEAIQVFQEACIENLPWSDLDVDLVMECSGSFSDRTGALQHIQQGAQRVLFSQPAENDVDATVVFGVNHQSLLPQDRIISNASCTTNCLVPVLHVLDEQFGIEAGLITTIHSAMNDQPVIDAYHHNDLRKTRSAMQSIIPVDTQLAKGISRILPRLEGRFQAQAFRVPTVNVSVQDLSLQTSRRCSAEEVNEVLTVAKRDYPENVLGTNREPLASCDFNHDPRSSIVDLNQTTVAGENLVKVVAWFDNEWAYANRMLDVAQYIGREM